MLSPGFKLLIETAPVSKRASELNVSSALVPTGLSKPVVSVNVEPATPVDVEPLPVVASIVAGVTVAAVVALTAVPPKVKPVTPPVVTNLVATVPLVPGHRGA